MRRWRRMGGTAYLLLSRLYIHTTGHFHVERMAEPVTVVPVDTRLIRNKGNGGRLLWADFHTDTMVHHTETVGYVFDLVNIGNDYSYFITLVDGELGCTK